MKFSQSSRGLPWTLVVAIALASLPIGAGVKAEPPINSEADETMSTVATYTESLDQAVKHRSWPPEKVFIAEATSNGENRVTFLSTLPTPCYKLRWHIPREASADGLLHIEAWWIPYGEVCIQVMATAHAELTFHARPFKQVAVNGVIADEQNDLMEEAFDIPWILWVRSSEPPASTPDLLPVPGPLPVAGALAGWHSARRLRRRCKKL
jgi:hypothetical protein